MRFRRKLPKQWSPTFHEVSFWFNRANLEYARKNIPLWIEWENSMIHGRQIGMTQFRKASAELHALRPSKFSGPHILTSSDGSKTNCCGNASGCKWCAKEACEPTQPNKQED